MACCRLGASILPQLATTLASERSDRPKLSIACMAMISARGIWTRLIAPVPYHAWSQCPRDAFGKFWPQLAASRDHMTYLNPLLQAHSSAGDFGVLRVVVQIEEGRERGN